MGLRDNGLVQAIIFLLSIVISLQIFLLIQDYGYSKTIENLSKKIGDLEKNNAMATIEVIKNNNTLTEKEYETSYNITYIVNEYYDGDNLFYSNVYTNEPEHQYSEEEIDNIVYSWDLSGYDYVNISEEEIDGVTVINLYFEKRASKNINLEEIDVSDDEPWGEYEWLLHCVAAENGESYDAAWWTASCIVNRAEYEYGSIEAAVRAPGQFSVYSSGSIYARPVYDCAVEAVNDVLNGNRNYEVYYFSSGNLHSDYATIIHVSGNEYFYSR